MIQGWLWNGAQFVVCDSVPLTDRGFRYGMSVFESMPVRDGAFIFLAQHLARLHAACTQCGFAVDLPPIAAVQNLSADDGFARLYVTAGEGSVTDCAAECRVFVFIEPRDPVPARVYHRGYDLGIEPVKHAPLFGGLKTGNYWANLLAFRAGVARQKNESLLFNQAGELISACMANVFVVRDGRVLTPPLASGARDGVVRGWVLRQHDVEERSISREEVMTADEIFLTSSWLGIMPVASVEEYSVPSLAIGKSLVRAYCGAG